MRQNRIRGTAVFSQKEKGDFGGWKMWFPAWNGLLSHAPPRLEPRPGGGWEQNTVPPEPSQGLQTPGGSPAKHHGAAVAGSREPELHRLGALAL